MKIMSRIWKMSHTYNHTAVMHMTESKHRIHYLHCLCLHDWNVLTTTGFVYEALDKPTV